MLNFGKGCTRREFSMTTGFPIAWIFGILACGMHNGAPCYAVTVWDESGQKFNDVDN